MEFLIHISVIASILYILYSAIIVYKYNTLYYSYDIFLQFAIFDAKYYVKH